MKTAVSFFLLFIALLKGEDLEVRVPTRTELRPVYVTQSGDKALREVLLFDLQHGGFASLVSPDKTWDLELRTTFDPPTWRRRRVAFVISIEDNQIVAHDVLKGATKTYPLGENRRQMHQVADRLHLDLFGVEGIASLHLLYSEKRAKEGGWVSEICSSDSDGAQRTQLTHTGHYCIAPGYLPNGDFYYVGSNQGQSKLYRASLGKPRGVEWITLRGNQTLPAVSRKGKQVAFITDVAGRPDLFLWNLDSQLSPLGQARQLFSAPRATQASPTFSPDGKRIAFVSDKDGPPRIYVLDIANPKDKRRPKAHLITKRNRENTSPAWSPDGRRIAYSARTDGIRQIWIYDFESDDEWQLTQGPENKENPAWAPDSIHLVYNTESNESCELFLINLRNPEPVQISSGSGMKRFANWEPLR